MNPILDLIAQRTAVEKTAIFQLVHKTVVRTIPFEILGGTEWKRKTKILGTSLRHSARVP